MAGSLAQNGTSPHFRARSLALGRAGLVLAVQRSLDDDVDLLGGRDVVVRLQGLLDLDLVDLELLDRSSGFRLDA